MIKFFQFSSNGVSIMALENGCLLTDAPTNVPEAYGNLFLVASKLSSLWTLWRICVLGWRVSNDMFKTVSSFNFRLMYAFYALNMLNSSSLLFFNVSNSFCNCISIAIDIAFWLSPYSPDCSLLILIFPPFFN